MKNNSFRKGKIQGEIAKKLQKGQVIRPNVFQTKMEDEAYSKKGWLNFRKEGTKAFLKRLASCSDMANLKDPPKAI